MPQTLPYQHGGSDVELLLELSDEDVHGDEVLVVLLLDFSDDICHPLELLLCARHPDEVHLRCTHAYHKGGHIPKYILCTIAIFHH